MFHSKKRFSDRVSSYCRARPGYPLEVYELLLRQPGLQAAGAVADLGSGTGIFTGPLLGRGRQVYAVEPNAAMRRAAEEAFADRADFISVRGSAEETTLESHSVALVVGAQAFHWFDFEATRIEVQRILRPKGYAAWVWNSRAPERSAFLLHYERFLTEWGRDYEQVRATYAVRDRLGEFFAPGSVERHAFPNSQDLDFDSLEARIASSSYMPSDGDPDHAKMVAGLRELFDADASDGRVRLDYDTEVFLGRFDSD